MLYIQQSLRAGENLLPPGRIRQTRWQYFSPLFFAGVITFLFTVAFPEGGALVGFSLMGLLLLWVYLMRWSTEMACTDRRMIVKRGLIARNTEEINLNAIENLRLVQGIVGRIFGYGEITARGRGGGEVIYYWVANPVSVKRTIEEAVHKICYGDGQNEGIKG